MANFRILSNNFITSSTMIQASLQKTGVVTNPIKDGTGKATMETTGAYSTGIDNQYKVQITVTSSKGIGTNNAGFTWFRNDSAIAATWTSTAFKTLENDVQVKWSSGLASATDAFGSALDQWTFEGKNLFGINQMIDRKRNTRWRSSTDALELHTDTNAMADPAGNEGNALGFWGATGIGVFVSTDTTFSAGAFSLSRSVTASTAEQGFNTTQLTNPDSVQATLKYSFDVSLKQGEVKGILEHSTEGFVRTLFTDNTTNDFVSRSFFYIPRSTGIKASFNQNTSDAASWFTDNLSLKVLPGFVINLSNAQEVDAVIIQDHNLTSNAEILLRARPSTTWPQTTSTSNPVEETIPWQSGAILHYVVSPSNTQQYWRLDISDTGNPDGYIEIGNLYLGSFDEVVRNAAIGYKQTETVIGSRNIDPYGVEDNRFRNRQKTWQYKLPASTDIETLEGVFDNIYSSTSGKYDPVWINPTSNSTDFHMGHIRFEILSIHVASS